MYKAERLKHTMLEAQCVKEEHRWKHPHTRESNPKLEWKKVVIAEQFASK